MTKKILVAVDGSPPSLRALRYAIRRGRGSKAFKLIVLAVQPRIDSRRIPRATIDAYLTQLAEEALKPARAVIEETGVDADCYARRGEPARTIVDLAKRARCSEIVMGTRGLGRLAGLVLGSVAMKVLHLSSVPVVLVK